MDERRESQDASEGNGTETATDTSSEVDDTWTIQKDDAFHVLQNARRRAVLRYLLDHEEQGAFRMRDLAEEVAAWEHGTTVRQLSSDERQRVYIALYQSHLPKLDDHDIIDYDQSRGVVEPTPLIYALEPFLDVGLHAETDVLSVEDVMDPEPSGVARTFSALLSR